MTTTGIGREEFERALQTSFIPSDIEHIMFAYRLSKYGHGEQKRDDDTRYFEHPKWVALSLLRKGVIDPTLIVAALLHDLMEDSFLLEWQDIERIFNKTVCYLVKMVTKDKDLLTNEQYLQRVEHAGPEVWILKIADRLHNLSTVKGCTPEKQNRIMAETKRFYLPLCRKLCSDEEYSWLGRIFLEEMAIAVAAYGATNG